jgi:mono/diheme cytochrome c family protein
MLIRLLLVACTAASLFAMDPQRGAQVARDQNCLTCHNVRGQGELKAPDLAGRLMDHYTPSTLASLLWNHLPEMWTAMSQELVGRPRPSARDAEDLFGYLYAAHYANPAGTVARGQRAFEQRGCAACHTAGPGNPVENWRGIRDPFALVQQMWNHSTLMQSSRASRGVVFEKLSARDLADLTTFVSKGAAPAPLTLPESAPGEALFKANCGACHPAIVNLSRRLLDRTPAEVAAGVWNHAASMQTVPLAAPNSMRNIVGYVWNLQFEPAGNAQRGARVFTTKRCATCHAQMSRGEKVMTPYTLIADVWAHGPRMEADMQKNRSKWPYLTPTDVDDLVAYLNRRP